MKALILALVIFSCLFTLPASADMCENVALTDITVQKYGRLARAEVFAANRSHESVIAGIIFIIHRTRSGKEINVDFKFVNFDLYAGSICSFNMTFPLPRNAISTNFVLTDFWTENGEHIDCIKGKE